MFRDSKGGQGRKGAVLVRIRTEVGREEEGGAVGLLVEIFSVYIDGELTGEAHLTSYQGKEGWRV